MTKNEELQLLKNQFILGQHTRFKRICIESGASTVEDKIKVANKVLSQWCSGTNYELLHEQNLLKMLK